MRPPGLVTLTHGTSCGQAGPAHGIVVHGIYRDFFFLALYGRTVQAHVTGRREWSCTTRT